MNICKDCTHMRRGRAIDHRKAEPDCPAPAPRGRRQGGDFICARHPITPARVDPQTGFQAQPSGEDCRDLNPAGECEDFAAGMQIGEGLCAVIIFCALLAMSGLYVLSQG